MNDLFLKTFLEKLMALTTALLSAGSVFVFAQNTVKGTVYDERDNPLVGVTVIVEGTANGTNTDASGGYALAGVKKGDVLHYSCIGLSDVRVTFDGSRSVINVRLKEDANFLNESVVVGYGTQQKASLTGSVAQIRGDDILKGPATNVSSVLAGKLTGVSSVQESGQPGSDQAALRVRGSIYGVNYIVDGMPRSINDIDPNDIETVSVLKDASAAAVYGLSGAGGVVIITTKKGVVGNSRITYNGSAGVSVNTNFPKFLDGPGYAWYYNKALELDANDYGNVAYDYFTDADVYNMKHGYNGWGNTDWIKKTFGTGTNSQHSLTVQGGTEKIRYFASLGYMDQKGNVKNFNYKRYNARLNLDASIKDNLHFTMGIAGQLGDQRQPGLEAGGSWSEGTSSSSIPWYSIAEQAIFAHPYLPEYHDGLPTGSLTTHGESYNPIAAINGSGSYKTLNTNIQTNVSLKWDVPWTEGLSASVTGAFDKTETSA